jgi:CRISPR type IV-associated protein Csf1
MTASELFAGDHHNPGTHKCFYCGASCDDKYKAKDYVKPTFTNRDVVKYPGSEYVCAGCVESMSESATTKQIDGTIKTERSGAPRLYSWIITKNKKIACTKKHLRVLRRAVLSPPEPPFSIVLTESGQKQIIFRSIVNYDRDVFYVTLDERNTKVIRNRFKKYLQCAVLCSAAIGKKGLKNPEDFFNYKSIAELYGNGDLLLEWVNYYLTPMGVLAAWLCPGKEEALKNENVISRRVQEKDCGSFRPFEGTAANGTTSDQRRRDQVLFDFT